MILLVTIKKFTRLNEKKIIEKLLETSINVI